MTPDLRLRPEPFVTPGLRAGPALAPEPYARLLRRAVFEACKWNLTAYDVPTLARFPILISARELERLSGIAEALAREALQAEEELLQRPELHARLGLDRRASRLLQQGRGSQAPRFLRVDFHPTAEGYRITEANTDVAGGFIEGSGGARLWTQQGAGKSAGDPAGALAAAFTRAFGVGAPVGLLHLSQYTDDRQVVSYLARRFDEAGLRSVLMDVSQLRPGLRAVTPEGERSLEALFRFFPGEWLGRLPTESGWRELFASDRVSNPVGALLTDSKRFPLAWAQLRSPMQTWRAFLPETRSPEEVEWPSDERVLKPAFGHEGSGVSLPGVTSSAADRAAQREAQRSPHRWVVQRRFQLTPLETPDGVRFVCVGIYVVDGRAAGAYARVATRALIDDAVQDAVVLLED